MIILGQWQAQKISISVKPNCLTVSIEGKSQSDVYSFDYAGRPWTAIVNGVSHRRGLDGKTVAKWILPDRNRGRRWLSPVESEQFAEKARETADKLTDAIERGAVDFQGELPQAGLDGLRKAAAFGSPQRDAEIERYHEVYLPVGILPPDQYGAVVLQATEGCSFNACTFCSFYKDRKFRIKNPEEYARHCVNVRNFLGEGLSLRRTIFLGDANALVTPMTRLVRLLEITHETFDVTGLGGIFAFLDGVSGERKTASDYSALRKLGLERVYIGLESGSEELLRYLHKPSTPGEVVKAVRSLKIGGVSVGVIILLGAGGKRFAKQHVRDTIKTINSMQLDMEDILYFSELVESEGMDYLQQAVADRLQPLNAVERIRQSEMIESELRFSGNRGTPHISRYDIREFVY